MTFADHPLSEAWVAVERSLSQARRLVEPVYWLGARVLGLGAGRAVERFERTTLPTSFVTVFYERRPSAADGATPASRPRGDVWVTTRPLAQARSRAILATISARRATRLRLAGGERARLVSGAFHDPGRARSGFTVVTPRALVVVSARLRVREHAALAA